MIEIIALLEIKNKSSFKEFEEKAIKIMKNHGGKLLSAFDINKNEPSLPNVGEVHYLQFPNIESFYNYRSDPALTALSALRNKAISKTTILVSNEFVTYN